MTKPTSRLTWYPDAVDPLAIRAVWIGAGWHYTLEWGHLNEDGTAATDAMMFWDPPKRHVYPVAGKYTLVGRPGLPHQAPVSSVVTLRTKLKPQASFELLDDRRTVRATLEHLDDDVRYRVDWGDHIVTEHDVNDLAPEHQYPAGFGTPTITVTDLPARRNATFTGPEIPDPAPPEDTPRMQFTPTKWAPDWGGDLELFGFPPNTKVDLGGAGWRSSGETHGTLPGQVTTDGSGYAKRYYKLLDDEWQFDDWWQVWSRWTDPDDGTWHQMYLPVQWCEYAGGPDEDATKLGPCWKPISFGEGSPRTACNQFALLVDWEITKPWVITLYTAQPGPVGEWSIDWGDGKTETVTSSTGRLSVTRDYGANKDVWVKVTRPDGRAARRRLRNTGVNPTTWKDGSLAIFWNYEAHVNDPPCTIRDCDAYTVIRIDPGDGRPLVQGYRPSLHCPDRAGYGISYTAPGDYDVTVYAPMSPPQRYTHQQKTRGARAGEFVIKPEEPQPNPLTQTFHVGDTTKPGRYTAQFRLTNNGDQPVPWQLDFTLAAPAVLADVQSWVGTAAKEDLGDGRWRITCDQPARVKDPWPVEITVEPCGDPRIWPTDVDLRVPQT